MGTGTPCPVAHQTTEARGCDVCDSPWTDWSECATECTRTRLRGPCNESQFCEDGACKIDCAGEWRQGVCSPRWSLEKDDCKPYVKETQTWCSPHCNASEVFVVLQEPIGAGASCPDTQVREAACTDTPCRQDCVGAFTQGECLPKENATANCSARRTFVVTVPELGFGAPCEVADLFYVDEACVGPECDVHCTVEWTEWTVCAHCTQHRSATVRTDHRGGGQACPELEESRMCAPCDGRSEPPAFPVLASLLAGFVALLTTRVGADIAQHLIDKAFTVEEKEEEPQVRREKHSGVAPVEVTE